MKIPIHTNGGRWRLHLCLGSGSAGDCLLRVSDSRFANSDYLRRRIPFSAASLRNIEVPLPVSPPQLLLELSGQPVRVQSLQLDPMEDRSVLATPERHRFMEFATAFARRAGYLPAGDYPDPSGKFLIRYPENIRNERGRVLLSPARINRSSGRVEIARSQFRRFSIPVRVAILAHEACHFFLDTRSETTADRCGLAYYLDMGFPRIEAVYTATKVFGQFPEALGPDTLARTRQVVDFIQNYSPHGNKH